LEEAKVVGDRGIVEHAGGIEENRCGWISR
jgi:hypothetical protein